MGGKLEGYVFLQVNRAQHYQIDCRTFFRYSTPSSSDPATRKAQCGLLDYRPFYEAHSLNWPRSWHPIIPVIVTSDQEEPGQDSKKQPHRVVDSTDGKSVE